MAHPGIVSLKKTATLLATGATGGGAPVFDVDYQAILTYALIQGYATPSAETQQTQNALLSDLKASGVWAELDVFYNFFTDGDHDFAKINWKSPGAFQAVGTGHEPIFSPFSGFKGDGVGKYLNTQWTPSVNAVKLQPINIGLIIDGSFPAFTVYMTDLGASSGGARNEISVRYGSTLSTYYLNNSNNFNSTSAFPNDGTYHAKRTALNAAAAFRNGVFQSSSNVNTTAVLPPVPIYLLANNNNGVANTFSNSTLCMAAFGASLTGKEAAFYSSWVGYKNGTIAATAYKKIIDYATLQGYTLPSVQQQADQKKLLNDLYTAGVWDELDVFYNFLTNGDANFAKINWKNPGVNNAVQSGVVTFILNDGFRGDGVTGFFNTGFIVTPGVSRAQFGNMSFLLEVDKILNDDVVFGIGAISSASIMLIPSSFGTSLLAVGSGGFSQRPFPVYSNGFFQGQINVDQQRSNINGAVGGFITVTSVPDNINSILLFGPNGGLATPYDYSNGEIRCFGIGSKSIGSEAALYNSWKAYRDKWLIVQHPYDRVIEYATALGYGLPSVAQQTLQRQFVDELISAGVWNELDIFYNLFTDGSFDFAKINWKNPGANTLVSFGGVAFVANSGVNLTAGSLNTGFRPSPSTMFKENSSFGLVCRNWSLATSYMWGGYSATSGERIVAIQRGGNNYAINTAGLVNYPAMASGHLDGGFIHIQMNNAVDVYFSIDGNLLNQTYTSAGNFFAFSSDWYIGGMNFNTPPPNATVDGVQLYFAGGSMFGKGIAFYNAWIKYKATVISKVAYKAIIDYAILQGYAQPSAAQQVLQERLIYDLVVVDVWDQLDVFYNFLTDGNEAFARINWKAPGTFQATLAGTVPFIANDGFRTSENAANVISTNYNPFSNGVKYTLNDAAFGGDNSDNVAPYFSNPDKQYVMLGGSGILNQDRNGTGTTYAAINQTGNFIGSTQGLAAGAFNHMQRTGSTSIRLYRSAVAYLVLTNASTAISNGVLRAYGQNMTFRMMFAGASLTGKESAFYNTWNAYKFAAQAKSAYKEIIDYATLQGYTIPSTPQQTIQEKLIYDLMSNGIWGQLDVFYNFITNGDHNFAKINWKDPGTFQADGTGHEPTFTVNSGFKGGPNLYLNTQWNPSIHGIKYTLNDAAACISVEEDIDNLGCDFGADSSPNRLRFISRHSGTNSLQIGINGAIANFSGKNTNSIGFYHVKRINATTGAVFKNGIDLAINPPVSSALPTITALICSAGGTYSPRRISMFCTGASLAGKEVALYNAWTSYKSSVSALSVDLTLLIGTDGVDKGYLNGVYGGVSPLMIGDERITGFYSQADNTIHLAFEGAAQIEGVDRIMIQIPGEEAELLWTGIDYAGVSIPVATQFSIVDATVNFTLAT